MSAEIVDWLVYVKGQVTGAGAGLPGYQRLVGYSRQLPDMEQKHVAIVYHRNTLRRLAVKL